MKRVALLISFALLQTIPRAQANQLNELLSKYGWPEYRSFAAQQSRLLFVPDRSNPEMLGVMKWQDLIEGCIEIHYNGDVVKIALVGKVKRYVKCSNANKTAIRYLGKSYKAFDVSNKIFMFLNIDSSLLPATIERLKAVLHQLNNMPVSDTNYHDQLCYHCGDKMPKNNQRNYFDEATSQIVICNDSNPDKKPFGNYWWQMRNAKKVSLEGFDTFPQGPISVIGFSIYIVKS